MISNYTNPSNASTKRWSITKRITLLVVFVGCLSLLTQVLVLVMWVLPMSDENVSLLAVQIRSIQTSLEVTDVSQRDALAKKLSGSRLQVQQGLLPRSGQAGTALALPPPDRIAAQLRNLLGPNVIFRATRVSPDSNNAKVMFEFVIDGQAWNATYQIAPPIIAITNSLLVWALVLAIVVISGLYFGARQIARPISNLVTQIADLKGAINKIDGNPKSPAELHSIVEAFNALVASMQESQSIKQQLLAGVSHDLRTPLSRLRLRVETQCEESLAREMEADLSALEHITNQFLAYTQGELSPDMGPLVWLADICETLVSDYVAQGLDVSFNCATKCSMRVPQIAMRRVLVNLIDNAYAYGKPPVVVELNAQSNNFVLAVSDAGEGMTVEQFSNAQKPFVRLGATRHQLGHCGLGLAIVSQIAQQLGAVMSVRPLSAQSRFGVSLTWFVET